MFYILKHLNMNIRRLLNYSNGATAERLMTERLMTEQLSDWTTTATGWLMTEWLIWTTNIQKILQ